MKKEKQISRPALPRCTATVFAVLAIVLAAPAQAEPYEDINLTSGCHAEPRTFGFKAGASINEEIAVNFGNPVFWAASPDIGCANGTTPWQVNCGPATTPNRITVAVPDQGDVNNPTPVQPTLKATIKSNSAMVGTDPEMVFRLKAANGVEPNIGIPTCEQTYRFRPVSDAAMGGWGDPHLTTFDGTNYDFQSAGEFTALKSDRFELQTRQAAVPTATVPITNAYTGITHCVAVFSAVAARVGSTRVTLQPPTGKAASQSMVLRVNGKETDLTDNGIELTSRSDVAGSPVRFDGRIKKAVGDSIEIVASDGAQIVVTPAFWDTLQLWYLNIKVHQSSAQAGTMGMIHKGNWLPNLPDGTGLGPKPLSEGDRYKQLYEVFADAWRVTTATSLFDYKTGTEDTSTFTLDEWPRNNPQNCGLPGQTSVQPATQAAAEQACAAVTNAMEKANCVFDVMITGHLGFGKSYENMQKFKPHGDGWQTHVVFPNTGGGGPDPTTPRGIPLWVWILIFILILSLIWILWRKKSTP